MAFFQDQRSDRFYRFYKLLFLLSTTTLNLYFLLLGQSVFTRPTKVRVSHLTKNILCMLFRICEMFCKRFNVSKGSPFNFFVFRIELDFQKAQSPFYNFRHCEIFPTLVFKLSQVFSARYNRILFFFSRPAFFPSDFLICFHRKSSQFLLETKRFASIEDSLGFLALCDLPRTSLKIFLQFLVF